MPSDGRLVVDSLLVVGGFVIHPLTNNMIHFWRYIFFISCKTLRNVHHLLVCSIYNKESLINWKSYINFKFVQTFTLINVMILRTDGIFLLHYFFCQSFEFLYVAVFSLFPLKLTIACRKNIASLTNVAFCSKNSVKSVKFSFYSFLYECYMLICSIGQLKYCKLVNQNTYYIKCIDSILNMFCYHYTTFDKVLAKQPKTFCIIFLHDANTICFPLWLLSSIWF